MELKGITQDLLNRLTYMLDSSSFVFWGQHGKLTRHGVYFITKRCLKQIGVTDRKLGGHRIRHTVGRDWCANGGDLQSLRLLLRQSTLVMAMRYASLADAEVAEKHRQFSPLRRVYA